MRLLTVLLIIALAGIASAAPRGFEPEPTQKRQKVPMPRVQQIVAKPDLEPAQLPRYAATYQTPKVWVVAHAAGSPQSLAKARNNGPGVLEASSTWRLRCRVIAKEFDLGPCFYHTIPQAEAGQGAYEMITFSGPVGTVSVPSGGTFEANFTKTFVNCREDQGGRCRITLELDMNDDIDEADESNNVRTYSWP